MQEKHMQSIFGNNDVQDALKWLKRIPKCFQNLKISNFDLVASKTYE